MIQSMTGYGTAEHVADGVRYLAEVRSVNHRYLKLSIRLPDAWQFAESTVDRVLRDRLSRGSVTFSLRVRSDREAGLCSLNQAALQQYVDALARIKVPSHVQPTLDLAVAATLPGVTNVQDFDNEARQQQTAIVQRVANDAVSELIDMRHEEGVALQKALMQFGDEIRIHLREVTSRASGIVDEYREKLHARIATLMKEGGFELQQDALAREVAVYAERCDIAEELTRIGSHLDQFSAICDRSDPVGRTLDFLTQELLREANTIASKSGDAGIAQHTVAVKGIIDRLKEQVQNVE